MQGFQGRVAIVTGAASGIGLALCQVFAEQGMKIVLADVEQEALTAAADSIEALGVECLAVVCDVSDPQAVEELAALTVQTFGAIHIACNNAGVFAGGTLWESSLDDYEWLIAVNQYGVINGIRSFVPRMIDNGEPCHLVNTASMAALTSMPFSGIYNMTKHAVLALSETLFHELSLMAPQVGVSCLCPEAVATGIGHSQRNRPETLSDTPASDGRSLAEEAIVSTAAGGKSPRVLAERVLQGIRDQQFYLLSEDTWRDTANARLEDIGGASNPRLLPPEI
jgi:NAD(P)-dependent dehydrogenase (short-subunit alcohol dehydrogenase family)